ncbi:hypothetical protein TNCV_3157291 [Trichonephila clavipes]|nr:hypothetical protein TNCV_3157291 [Trichonephila clavipes]
MMVDDVHKDEKEQGLKTPLCGFPAHILRDSESAPLNLKENFLPLRKSFIHNNALSLIPVPWIVKELVSRFMMGSESCLIEVKFFVSDELVRKSTVYYPFHELAEGAGEGNVPIYSFCTQKHSCLVSELE